MYPNRSSQRGFLLPVAIFLVVGISALAIGVSKLSSQSGVSVFREGIAMQAFYAAESATQWGMNQVMFPDANRTTATANCAAVEDPDPSVPELVFNTAGLQDCRVDIACTSSDNSAGTITFFTLTSSASCGAGELLSERTIQATAYIRD